MPVGVRNRRLLINRLSPQQPGRVLIHHGVPAVLGMLTRLLIEALSFIRTFAQALRSRRLIKPLAIARQQLLTLYKFNYPAWTLPVLYLHPDFDGNLSVRMRTSRNYQEFSIWWNRTTVLQTSLRSLSSPGNVWSLRAGFARVGRSKAENNIVIPEPWVSQQHAIFCRNTSYADTAVLLTSYRIILLRDAAVRIWRLAKSTVRKAFAIRNAVKVW